MNASATAYSKLDDLKKEQTKIEEAITRAKENVERLKSIPSKLFTDKNKADLTLAENWLDKIQKRYDAIGVQIATIEIGVERTIHKAKPFMSRSGKPMRP